jgi:N,N'-diacetylchitobiose phosphorylase
MITARATYTAHLLSNGPWSVLLGPAGGGCSILDGFAMTRWVPDPTCDDDGLLLFIRDLDTGLCWTAASDPGSGCVSSSEGLVSYTRVEDHIESVLEIVVVPGVAAELRRLVLRNAGDRSRRLDVTTFAELALNTLAGDAAHPGFSRLFVETAYEEVEGALLAWRRLRSPDDRPLCAVHALLGGGPLQYETDRATFVGRGRRRSAPAALAGTAMLGGTTGSVLDPVFALRRTVTLQPGESVALTAVLGAAATRDAALAIARSVAAGEAVEDAFRNATRADPARAALRLPAAWRDSVCAVPVEAAFYPYDGPPRLEPPPAPAATEVMPQDAARPESLLQFNGWGGFSVEGTEYVILMPRDGDGVRRPPLPWVNVLANEETGCIVSEAGSLSSWSANSRENRLTPWSNDPVRDPHGEALFLRDEESGQFWSPVPGPRPGSGGYEVRHGFGYSRFLHESAGLRQETVVFVPVDLPARIIRVRVTNAGTARRRLSLWSFAQLVLGTHEADTRGRVETWWDEAAAAILAVRPDRGEFDGRIAFARALCDAPAAAGWTTDRSAFLGWCGSIEAPAALVRGVLEPFAGGGHDPCAAFSLAVTVEPGASVTCAFVLGEAGGMEEARAALARCADIAAVDTALHAARRRWAERVGAVTIKTPSPAIDLMVNGWLTYQNLACRMWARSAYYQSGGAFGFRDQLQDSSALLYLDPSLTRSQILLHAAHQFVEGDVLHWWHPPASKGIRTRFADDLLWLPYITAFYVDRTGDDGVLDEVVRFLDARRLEPGEDEAFLVPVESGTGASLYEHCCRAIDRSLTRGMHGLPLMGVGDWNDGMNRVGREGRGESVWLGFFLYDILAAFLPICRARGDGARAAAYAEFRENLGHALNDGGWDGAWYRRAYYDSGAPLGASSSDECRIDALAQAWAVLSGAAPRDRAAAALDAMEHHLVSEEDGIIRLLAPPFDRTPNDPGYIRGYLPGVRENGGQYTHGVLWSVRALADHGRCERAARLLEMLSPVTHGGSPERARRYKVEPYVIAADVYGVEPHVGRGGWTWYTGSAGWMYRIAIESVLGLELHRGRELRLRPCIPADWPGFCITLRMPDGTAYAIEAVRGDGAASISADGGPAAGAVDGALVIPLVRDGAVHEVRVQLGGGIAPRYEPR